MRMKRAVLAAAAAGAAALLAVTAVSAQDAGEGPPRTDRRHHTGMCGPHMHGPHFPGKMRVVHSETKIQTGENSFATHIVDAGTVTGVDGSRVTIRRADGQTVAVTATGDTRVCRNAAQAGVSDIRNGDHAAIMQSSKDGATQVRAIKAFSEDFKPPARPDRRTRSDLIPRSTEDAPRPTSI